MAPSLSRLSTPLHRRGGLWPPPFYSLFSQATTGRPYDPPIPSLSQGHLSTPALPLRRVTEGLKRDPPCPVCQLHRAVGAAFGRLLFIPFSARRPQVAPTTPASPRWGRRFLPQRGRMSAQLTGEGEACQLFLSVCSDPHSPSSPASRELPPLGEAQGPAKAAAPTAETSYSAFVRGDA